MSELIIEAGRSEGQYWRDLWRYRELFYVLAWRDVTVRYKQTSIGVIWALLVPLVNTVLQTFIFRKLAHMNSVGNAPYALMVFAGTMPWLFFSGSLSGAMQSVTQNTNLISKIYFPRLIIPAGAVVTALADLGIQFFLLAGMMAFFHVWPTWHLLFLPFFVLLAFGAALGPGLFLTSLIVKYRDFRFVIGFLMQVGAYITPVGYASSAIRDRFGELGLAIYSLNPMVGVIDGFRWAILGADAPLDPLPFLISVTTTAAFMFFGIWYFRRMERSFADII